MKYLIVFVLLFAAAVFSLHNVHGKKIRPCPADMHHCPNHKKCCPKGHTLYCSYHQGIGRKSVCGKPTAENYKDAQANCNSIEFCK